MSQSELQAIIEEYGGKITEEMAQEILDFRKAGDDVVEEPSQ